MRRAMPGVAIVLLAACTSVPPPEPQVPERVDAIAALDTCGGRPLELEVPLTVVVGD